MYWCLLVCRVVHSHVSPSDPTGARRIEQKYVSDVLCAGFELKMDA
jgi:hypothetical protein